MLHTPKKFINLTFILFISIFMPFLSLEAGCSADHNNARCNAHSNCDSHKTCNAHANCNSHKTCNAHTNCNSQATCKNHTGSSCNTLATCKTKMNCSSHKMNEICKNKNCQLNKEQKGAEAMAETEARSVAAISPFDAFTGEITRNKVRLRLEANIDSPIIQELSRKQMLLVTGDSEDFYAVKPLSTTKAYVFRTFILDGKVEGSRVNIRLNPDRDAPIIGQLNTGDSVKGTVCSLNSKWLEIPTPESTQFFVAKEFIEKIGNESFLATTEKQKEQLNQNLNTVYLTSQSELRKPFSQINFDNIQNQFNAIISEYTSFPEESERAKELLNLFQDAFIQKKISYLETKTAKISEKNKEFQTEWATETTGNKQEGSIAITTEMYGSDSSNSTTSAESIENVSTLSSSQKQRLEKLEKYGITPPVTTIKREESIEPTTSFASTSSSPSTRVIRSNERFNPVNNSINNSVNSSVNNYLSESSWEAREKATFEQWLTENIDNSDATEQMNITEFYEQEAYTAISLKGILKPYDSPIKNRPGDFILIEANTQLPIGYLYSTKINLQENAGEEVTVLGSPRPNNHFAFPAFHILAVE